MCTNLFAHTVVVMTTSFKREQSIAYNYISKTFPTTHFKYIYLNYMPYRVVCKNLMEQSLEQTSYCDTRVCGKERKPRCNILLSNYSK